MSYAAFSGASVIELAQELEKALVEESDIALKEELAEELEEVLEQVSDITLGEATDITVEAVSNIIIYFCNRASDIIIYLCKHDINPNIVITGESYGETPLMYAALYCNKEAVEALINKGANVHARKPDGFTPLFYSLYNKIGKEESDKIISILVANKAVVTSQFKQRYRDIFHVEYKNSRNGNKTRKRKTRRGKTKRRAEK